MLWEWRHHLKMFKFLEMFVVNTIHQQINDIQLLDLTIKMFKSIDRP
jgi:hypothetical protein